MRKKNRNKLKKNKKEVGDITWEERDERKWTEV
jgi:hypothetical protein